MMAAMMSLGKTVLLGLVGAALLLGGSAQAAAPAAKVKVLGMQVEGADLSAKDKEDLFSVVQAKLRSYPSIDLLKPPERELTDEMMDLECIDMDVECLGKLGKKYGAESVFYTQVDQKGGGYALIVRVVAVGTGKTVRDQTTDVAQRAGLANAMEKEVEAVFGKPAPDQPPVVAGNVGLLTIDASVVAAKIYVDDEFVGTGSVKLKKIPGTYNVRLTADGYQEVILKVVVKPGEMIRRSVEMVEGSGVAPPDPDLGGPTPAPAASTPFYETWWFWTAVGVVVVGTTVGVVAATAGSESSPTGGVTFSVDPQNAWRDVGVQGGAP